MKKLFYLAVVALLAMNFTLTSCSKDETSSVAATGVQITPPQLALAIGETAKLTATVLPENATDKTIAWSSGNNDVATVADGLVTAIAAGSATITATTANGKQATCEVTVAETVIAVESIALDTVELALYAGDTYTLTATVLPENATDKTVAWSSSNNDAATVADGLVTAIAAGSATITATTANGKQATCEITVNPDVYAAGHDGNTAIVWKNGQILYSLTDGTYPASANSVYIYENDVYIAGYESGENGSSLAKIWKNGNILYPLSTNFDDDDFIPMPFKSKASSVFVENGGVYVAEYYPSWQNGRPTGKVWKNGEILFPVDGAVNSVFAYNGDLYSAVSRPNSMGFLSPRLWKNGTELYNFAESGLAMSVFVSNGDIYVAGSDDPYGSNVSSKIWKNSEILYSLLDGKYGFEYVGTNSIYVYGSDVYVAGAFKSRPDARPMFATVWKNGEALYALTDGANMADAYSVFVYDGDVYSAGYENNEGKGVAKVWKNDNLLYELTDGSNDARVYSVFVAVDS